MKLNQTSDSLDLNTIEVEEKDEMINKAKDTFSCFICLQTVEHPLFCPNAKCMKGVHEECINKFKDNVKCICGNVYKKEEWQSNQHFETISKFTLNAEKKFKELESKKCPIHEDELLKHYCYECKKLYCGTCIITTELNKHKNHRLMNYRKFKEIEREISSKIESIKKTIQEINDSYDKYLSSEKGCLDFLKDFIKTIDSKSKEINNQIRQNKERLENALNLLNRNYNDWIKKLQINKYNELSDTNSIKNKIMNNIEKNNFIEDAKQIQKMLTIKYEDINNKIQKLTNLKNTEYNIKYDENGRYEGEFIDNIQEGKGIFYYNDGSRYDGEWKNGIKEGKGIFYSDNDVARYDGEWKNDKREGRGINYWNDEIKYEGEWKNDKREGKGIYYWNDGDKYDGFFKDDKREGKGVFYFNNGDKYEGMWKNGKREGLGIYYYSNGVREIRDCKENGDIKVLLKINLKGEVEL